MFTGIIEELGTLRVVRPLAAGTRLTIAAALVTSDIANGDSIAVNGVCLTALETSPTGFTADVSPETLDKTSLGHLKPGSALNLERAMLATTRLGGHIVQGHIDARGTFISAVQEGDFYTVRIGFPTDLARYFIQKGSVAVEGISLTIATLGDTSFEIAIIPITWEMTNLRTLNPADPVNLEVDMIAKYVERMTALRQ